MNGRVYDPSIARFLSPDVQVPFPEHTQSYNRYSYVQNNPLSWVDPSGYGKKTPHKRVSEETEDGNGDDEFDDDEKARLQDCRDNKNCDGITVTVTKSGATLVSIDGGGYREYSKTNSIPESEKSTLDTIGDGIAEAIETTLEVSGATDVAETTLKTTAALTLGDTEEAKDAIVTGAAGVVTKKAKLLSKTGKKLKEFLGPKGPVFGNTWYRGKENAGIFNHGSFRAGWSFNEKTGKINFTIRIGKKHFDLYSMDPPDK